MNSVPVDSDLRPKQLEELCRSRGWVGQLIYLPCTSSTNDVAREMAEQGARDGTVVVADVQTRGRGRMGRRWNAPPGTALLCSILFRPSGLPASAACDLVMMCALAAADAIRTLSTLHVDLKWPNDLVVRGAATDGRPMWRKLGGLLSETCVSGSELEFVVVGIGINVNVPLEMLPQLAEGATSILAETGQHTDRAQLLAALLAEVAQRYERLRHGDSPFPEWAARLTTLGQTVRALTPGGLLIGEAEGVAQDGALLLRTPDGQLHRLLAADVTLASS